MQLPLPFDRRTRPTPREAWLRFHAEHPEVYQLFRRFAWDAKRAGRTRFSARTILHRIRWETAVNPDKDGGFKINDWYSPYYGRLLMHDEPEAFGEFFEVRELK